MEQKETISKTGSSKDFKDNTGARNGNGNSSKDCSGARNGNGNGFKDGTGDGDSNSSNLKNGAGEGGRSGGARNIGYLRVSTADQDLDKFRADVLQFAMDKNFGRVEFVQEKVSGKKPWRERKLGEVVDGMAEGDRLIVPELSRLGRSMIEILEILREVKAKGACIYAVKGGWELSDSIQSKIISTVLAMMAEVERDLISERTREALAAKRQAGVKLGRRPGPGKSKLDHHEDEIRALRSNGSTKTHIAKRYGTSVQNLSHWMRQRGIE